MLLQGFLKKIWTRSSTTALTSIEWMDQRSSDSDNWGGRDTWRLERTTQAEVTKQQTSLDQCLHQVGTKMSSGKSATTRDAHQKTRDSPTRKLGIQQPQCNLTNGHPEVGRGIAKPLPIDIEPTTEKPDKQPEDRNAGTHWILRHYKWEEGSKEGSKAMLKACNSEKLKDGIKRTQRSQSTFFPVPP